MNKVIRWVRAGVGFSLALALAGCASTGAHRTEAINDIDWIFANDAIRLDIAALPQLNLYASQPHTLLLGVLQLTDAQPFRDLLTNPQAMANMLGAGKPEAGIVQITRYVVSPGQCSMLVLDRVRQAKFIGVIAGYYGMNATTSAYLAQVPTVLSSTGWLNKTYRAQPAPLTLHLQLGENALLDARSVSVTEVIDEAQAALPLPGGGRELKLDAAACRARYATYATHATYANDANYANFHRDSHVYE